MNMGFDESIHETGDVQPARDHRIEEGAWQKAVAPPDAASRPIGLPQASVQTPKPTPSTQTSNRDG